MKVEIDTAALADAVAWTSRVIDARPSNPILAGVKLEAIDGTLQFSAFNYEISARHHIEAGVDEAGSVLVQGKLLAGMAVPMMISLLVLAGLGWTCTRVDMGYICGCIALVAGGLKYRNIIQFNSLTVQRFRNTYKDEMDLNKYNKYVDSHF